MFAFDRQSLVNTIILIIDAGCAARRRPAVSPLGTCGMVVAIHSNVEGTATYLPDEGKMKARQLARPFGGNNHGDINLHM